MAHSEFQEAADSPVDDMDSAAAAISRRLEEPSGEDIDETPSNDDTAQQSETPDDEQELEVEDEDEQEGEPETPAIDAPASLTAEEKAKFAELDPKSQQYVADLEARRASQVQSATTKAAEAQRAAEVAAARADAQAQARYAQQLKAFGDNMAPQLPDERLADVDPVAYNRQFAQYQIAKAQHDEFMQQVQTIGAEADNSLSEAEMTQRGRELMAIPEFQNEETRDAFLTRAETAAKVLGLDVEHVARNATAKEIKALSDIQVWKEESDKYRAALSRQMQRVREGKKATTAKPNAAQPSSSEGRGFRDAKQRARQSGSVDDAAAALRAAGF